MWERPADKNTVPAIGKDTHASICWWVAILVHGNRSGGCTGTSTAVGSFPVDSLAVFYSPSGAAS